MNREALGVVATVAGIAAAGPSVWQTVTHISDDNYRRPEIRHGERHVQYHMAREALVTVGAFGALGCGLCAGQGRSGALWGAMLSASGGFIAAMWSGGPTTGVWAPNRQALAVHVASTSLLAAGIALLKPQRRPRRRTRRAHQQLYLFGGQAGVPGG